MDFQRTPGADRRSATSLDYAPKKEGSNNTAEVRLMEYGYAVFPWEPAPPAPTSDPSVLKGRRSRRESSQANDHHTEENEIEKTQQMRHQTKHEPTR